MILVDMEYGVVGADGMVGDDQVIQSFIALWKLEMLGIKTRVLRQMHVEETSDACCSQKQMEEIKREPQRENM